MQETSPSSVYFARKRFRLPTALILAASLVTGASGCGSASSDAQTGEVVRVIDGDTLVINFDGEDQRVRLLNVDTPETKHPDRAVECLGPEATAFLESMLPPGTPVGLDFDVEKTDQYDRVLAAVALESGTLVNAEIARQGFGIAVLFEPNSKYFDTVREAQAEATANEVGLYDPAAECTVPAEIEQVTATIHEAVEEPVGETAAAAATAVGLLAAAIAAAKTLRAALEAGEDSVRWLAHSTAAGATLLAGLVSTIESGESRLVTLESKAKSLESEEASAKAAAQKEKAEEERAAAKKAAEEKKRLAEAAAEQDRKEAADRAETERIAAEAAAAAEAERLAEAERERVRNLPAPYVPPAPQPYVPPAPQPAPPVVQPPPAVQEPYPGYTGPRCYAPGGKTWKPCP